MLTFYSWSGVREIQALDGLLSGLLPDSGGKTSAPCGVVGPGIVPDAFTNRVCLEAGNAPLTTERVAETNAEAGQNIIGI